MARKYTTEDIDNALSNNFDDEDFDNYEEEDFDDEDYDDEDYDEEDYDEEDYDEDSYLDSDEPYDGEGDPYLDFSGGNSKGTNLLNMGKSARRIAFTIENTTENDAVIALTPASYDTKRAALVTKGSDNKLTYKALGGGVIQAESSAAENDIVLRLDNPAEMVTAGHNIDAVIDDGIIYQDPSDASKYIKVTASSKNSTIRHMREFLAKNPTAFSGLHITSNKPQMYETEMIMKKCTPFSVFGEERINFQDCFTPNNQLSDKIIVKKTFFLDNETLTTMTFPAQSKVTVTLVAGVTESASSGLKKKIEEAMAGAKGGKKVKKTGKKGSNKAAKGSRKRKR
ncbi:MAG: hypothetical protein IKR41_11650 [Bacteroidales bacterium]|nr:hypothetical protein [Bacteroidales bacterium]